MYVPGDNIETSRLSREMGSPGSTVFESKIVCIIIDYELNYNMILHL